ncbi:MAG TPA: maleylpyruvate isomerase family mycothiol-dependent enzyme [Acidimicrobiales bacterium]|nr:maleylpyruvate isomerase family mycothiol-dependent enzyme [Acidimicrobiales bacterium]
MGPDRHLAHLEADVDRLLAAAAGVLDEPVAACPGWTVTDLLAHQAGVYRFATAQLRADPGDELARFEPPEAGPALEVTRQAADELLATLRDTDPTEHRPNWAGEPTAAFWFRRMAQETLVHRVDAELAAGGAGPVDAELAVDGIDELGDTFLRHAAKRGITGSGETVHLHATDEGLSSSGEWMFTFHPDGVDVDHRHGKGDMAVRGPAGELLLFAWNRRPVDVECFGEPDPAEFWATTVRI